MHLPKAEWLMLCGSIPPGVSPDFYCQLIRMARGNDVKTLLDTDGDALQHGVEAEPTVVTPNQQEAERLLNRALITRAHFRDAAQRIKTMGAESVILSLGSRGAVATDSSSSIEVAPPASKYCRRSAPAMPWPPPLSGPGQIKAISRTPSAGESPPAPPPPSYPVYNSPR